MADCWEITARSASVAAYTSINLSKTVYGRLWSRSYPAPPGFLRLVSRRRGAGGYKSSRSLQFYQQRVVCILRRLQGGRSGCESYGGRDGTVSDDYGTSYVQELRSLNDWYSASYGGTRRSPISEMSVYVIVSECGDG